MDEELPDAPWATGGDALPDAPWKETPKEAKKPDGDVSFPREFRNVMSKINEDAIAGTLGAPVDWVNKLLEMQGVPTSKKPFLGSESIKSGMRSMGMSDEGAEPQTLVGKAAAGVGGGAVSALLAGGGLGGLTREVGEVLMSPAVREAGSVIASPAGNIASGAGAGAGGEIGGETFKGTSMEGPARGIGELIGGGIGGASPATKLRPEAASESVIGAYERLKLMPSVAEAKAKDTYTGRASQWLEGNILPQTFGGGSVMEAFKQRRLREITGIQKDLAEAYGAPAPRSEAGKAVQDSVMDTWVQNKEADGKLIGAMREKYGEDPLHPSNLVQAVVNPVGSGTSEAVRKAANDPMLDQAAALIRETGGVMTFSDLAALKTLYGGAMEPGPMKNVNDAQVGQLFNAVRKDMEEHIKTKSPEDFAALQKSNARYAQAQDDFRKYFKKLIGSKNVPVSSERAYEILTSAAGEKARGDIQEFKHVWDALPPSERGNLSATVLSRLGATDMSNPVSPENWSLGKFLSGYKNLSQEAKDTLFKGQGKGEVAKQLDDLVSVVQNIQDKITGLQSTSRSGSAGIMGSQLGAGLLVSFTMKDLYGVLAAMGGPYVVAQALTNPAAIKAISTTLRGVERAIESSARAGMALEAIPKLPQAQAAPQ